MYDVAIIGCGPVGAFAANLLGQAGLSVLVVEQDADAWPLPRAVHLDHEMMRLFQTAGLVEALAPGMRDTEGHLHVGADGGVIRYMGTISQPRPFSWSNDYFFYQPELETRLRRGLDRFDAVTLRCGVAFAGLTQDAEGVTLMLATPEPETVRARYVVACDGARSGVRKALGIALDDLGFEEPWLVIDAEVDGALRFPPIAGVPAGADLQKMSVMLCDPARPATVVPGRGNHRRWEFMLLPGEDDAAMAAPEVAAALVAPYLAGVPHRIVRASTYRFHGLIAHRWQQGRVFLAGDAAHQTPPFFGQGMCHGMRDVANLAWKLEHVLHGRAAPAVLFSYQPERDPHVRAVITAAVETGRYICELDPAAAAARDVRMRKVTSDRPRTAADLIPAIAGGIVAGGTAGAGERFIQPIVRTAAGIVLLDDVTGPGWRLFVRNGAPRLPEDVRVIDATALADDGALLGWLDARAADAVLVRPDHYVFGTAAGDGAALVARRDALLLGDDPERVAA